MTTFDLDQPLLTCGSREDAATWSIRHSVEEGHIFGGNGSGKTSGSGRTLALGYRATGFGGLMLTVKPDEKSPPPTEEQTAFEQAFATARVHNTLYR